MWLRRRKEVRRYSIVAAAFKTPSAYNLSFWRKAKVPIASRVDAFAMALRRPQSVTRSPPGIVSRYVRSLAPHLTCPARSASRWPGRAPSLPLPQRQGLDAGRKVEAALGLGRNRLQSDGAIGAADQRIGAQADANRRRRAYSLVISCQRAAPGTFFRRENVPDQNAARRRADVEAELAYSSEITLMAPSFGGVSALELLGRGDYKPEAAR